MCVYHSATSAPKPDNLSSFLFSILVFVLPKDHVSGYVCVCHVCVCVEERKGVIQPHLSLWRFLVMIKCCTYQHVCMWVSNHVPLFTVSWTGTIKVHQFDMCNVNTVSTGFILNAFAWFVNWRQTKWLVRTDFGFFSVDPSHAVCFSTWSCCCLASSICCLCFSIWEAASFFCSSWAARSCSLRLLNWPIMPMSWRSFSARLSGVPGVRERGEGVKGETVALWWEM